VLREALAVSRRVLRRFSNRFSPRRFTQPQLFACLVLKEFLGQDYRTAARLLADSPDLQKWIGLAHSPHYTTLHKASQRLLRAERAHRLLQSELARARRLGMLPPRVETAAIDATGLLAQSASHHFRVQQEAENARKRGPRRHSRGRRWPKLVVACDCDSHLIVAAHVERGPASDLRRFLPLVCDLYDDARPRFLVCDAGFDAEWIHTACRDLLDIHSLIPAKSRGGSRGPPQGKRRRWMASHLEQTRYHARSQVETVFSMLKRRLRDTLHARKPWAQHRAAWLKVLVHNLLILARYRLGFLQSPDASDCNEPLVHAGASRLQETSASGYNPRTVPGVCLRDAAAVVHNLRTPLDDPHARPLGKRGPPISPARR
jgi:hypothetical protein